MAVEFPDIVEQARRETRLPCGTGIPHLEVMTLLMVASQTPGLRKAELTKAARAALSVPMDRDRTFLSYVDGLVKLGLMIRYDFGYHMTPAGKRRFADLREETMPALKMIFMGEVR